MTEPYDIAVADATYRVAHEKDGDTIRICVYSDSRLRFSLPNDTPRGEIEKFIRVYALGVSDGKSARVNSAADRIREHLQLAARRLGRAAGSWKAGQK